MGHMIEGETSAGSVGRIPLSELIEVPHGIFARNRVPQFPVFDEFGMLVKDLSGSKTRSVFVVRDDVDRLRRYLSASLRQIVSAGSVRPRDRAWALHRVLTTETAEMLDRLSERFTPSDLTAALEETTRFLWRVTDAAKSLIQVAHVGEYAPVSHAVRTSIYATMLAKETGLRPGDSLIAVALAGIFADAGKAGMPAALLERDEARTDVQWSIIEQHPPRSVDVMRRMGISQIATQQAVLWHHERWDGTGYPDGITGHSMPFAARCVALADEYCSLTVNRFQRPALAEFEALTHMTEDAGHFDPELLRAFVRMIGQYANQAGDAA
jgi:HD-GYP domain-containing protein (c-di-GMP phosphodiesterase class II)